MNHPHIELEWSAQGDTWSAQPVRQHLFVIEKLGMFYVCTTHNHRSASNLKGAKLICQYHWHLNLLKWLNE